MTFVASGLAYDSATRDWTKLVEVRFERRADAVNWTRFNREWMKDLRIEEMTDAEIDRELRAEERNERRYGL